MRRLVVYSTYKIFKNQGITDKREVYTNGMRFEERVQAKGGSNRVKGRGIAISKRLAQAGLRAMPPPKPPPSVSGQVALYFEFD
jgi:hypothetical protein